METTQKIVIPDNMVFDRLDGNTIFLKENKFPETWEDCVKYLYYKDYAMSYIDNNSMIQRLQQNEIDDYRKVLNVHPEKYSGALLALTRLLCCYTAWMSGTHLDWYNHTLPKYCIVRTETEISIIQSYHIKYTFAFPYEPVAQHFYDTFFELFKTASILL
jgi:hypothetical protein